MDQKFEKILGARYTGVAREIEVAVGSPDSSNVVWTNLVKTTRYHLLTFIFENLWEQFHFFANVYFVGVAVLQLIPETSDSDGNPTALYSFIPILCLKMMADGWGDYQRWQNDKSINVKPVKRIQVDEEKDYGGRPSFKVEDTTWEALRVGDVIQLSYGEEIPADCIMLYASSAHSNAYVGTKNLDGESNLKVKVPVPITQKLMANELEPLCHWPSKTRLNYEVPNSSLYSFSGQIIVGAGVYHLSIDNLLLRGSTLQSDTVSAVVVYTGHMTRVYCNSAHPSPVISRLSQWYNMHIITLVVIQFALCSLVAGASVLVLPSDTTWYLRIDMADRGVPLFFKVIGRMLLLFAYYVPITLLMSLEVIRAAYRFFIQQDEQMSEKDKSPPQVNNSNVLEDLGVVSHIFTDKTGTLTENLMTFCAMALPGEFVECCLFDARESTQRISNNLPFCDHRFPAERVHAAVSMERDATQNDFALYVITLALCHTVEIRNDGESDILDGPSPDEFALVCGAQVLGIRFTGRPSPSEVSLQLSHEGQRLWNLALGQYGVRDAAEEVTCTICHVLEFDNVRKRMSVILDIKGVKLLLCKGADNCMLSVAGQQDEDGIAWLEKHLFDFSVLGLRTLLVGVRAISSREYCTWKESWDEAHFLNNASARESAIKQCVSNIECDLRLVGVTGIEDQLQDDVSATLRDIQSAGIKMWMLTGDKVETAINIAKSCNLITPTTYTSIFENTDVKAIKEQIEQVKKFLLAGKKLFTQGFKLDWGKDEKKEFILQMRKANVATGSQRLDESRALAMDDRRFSEATLSIALGQPNLRRDHSYATQGTTSLNLSANTVHHNRTVASVLGVEEDTDMAVFDTVSIVVTGECMHAILHDLRLRRDFFQLALSSCHSVLCCRSTPIQKSLVVTWSQLYLESKRRAMLAIGDGTNDVGMIVSARIGIGIRGKEGSQAEQSADIAISQFKHLRRLLFVHGREAWRRNTFVVYFTCFKNVAFCMTSLFFNVSSKFSGGDIYDPALKQWFNILLTGIPILLFALFDQQFPPDILHRSARLYQASYSAAHAGHQTFFYWFFTAVGVAAVCLYVPLLLYGDAPIEFVGHCVFLAVTVPANFILLWDSNVCYWFTWASIAFGLLSYPTMLPIFGGSTTLADGTRFIYFASPLFWFALFLAGIVSLFSHSLVTAALSSVVTPVRAIRRAWNEHKNNLKINNPEWRTAQQSDKHFWTRDFAPDTVCDAMLGAHAAPSGVVVPAKESNVHRRRMMCLRAESFSMEVSRDFRN